MKSGFKITNQLQDINTYFVLSNYEGTNEILLWGYSNFNFARKANSYDIGRWQPKGTKEKQLK